MKWSVIRNDGLPMVSSMADAGTDDSATERRMQFAYATVGEDRFRTAPIPSTLLRLYGGQVVAQALGAAQLTVPATRLAHSCHAYFVRAGDTHKPLDFTVSRDSDGRSFSARRVLVEQGGKLILSLSASFQEPENGPRHQFPMPDVPPPDELRPMADYVTEIGDALPSRHWPFWRRNHLFEWRPVEPFRIFNAPPESSRRHFWVKLMAPCGDDPAEHQRYLAYASDLHILHAGLAPLGIGWADDRLQTASIDHAIWFHDHFRVDDWLLYALDSPASMGARALGRGIFFTRDGRLVATASQEGLIRLLDKPRINTL